MTDVKHSGYKAAAQTALDTQLNSLANDSWSALAAEIDNSTNLYLNVDVEIVCNTIIPTGTDAMIVLYLVPSIDDTNFPTYTATGAAEEQENLQYHVGAVMLSLDAELHRHTRVF